ncbi:hypothetical protein J437_LFUL012171 [Ladona fulva]|uniref:CKK domain-containing protein n=1 Tax=Ladona fulva TaxID=123851 RepID=A0A8K0P454_LADFU|nr:hypothetical protein J437_LFUL012171 [Ladona fulva]
MSGRLLFVLTFFHCFCPLCLSLGGLPPAAYPRNSQGVAHKRSFQQSISPIPDLRSGLASPMACAQTPPAPGSSKSTTPGSSSGGATSTPSPSAPIPRRISHSGRHVNQSSLSLETPRRDEEEFVVHRGRGVMTLGRVASETVDTANGGSSPLPAAGKPSNWEDLKRTPSSSSFYAGRRSRRNSISDDSQLTIENFGGSKENLNIWNDTVSSLPHSGRAMTPTKSRDDLNVCVRSKPIPHRAEWEGPSEGFPVDPPHQQAVAVAVEPPIEQSPPMAPMESAEKSGAFAGSATRPAGTREKKTTFAALPSTTTWLQQVQRVDNDDLSEGSKESIKSDSMVVVESGVQLHDIRLKLEEKRRHIEGEKRRMEVVAGQQRQRVGKAAFLQAVVKGKGLSPHGHAEAEDLVSLRDMERVDQQQHRRSRPISPAQGSGGIEPHSMSTWARSKGPSSVILDNPESVSHFSAALEEVRSDIRRLAIQQQKHDVGMDDEPANSHQGEHFFLHGPAGGRRTWDSVDSVPPPFSLQQHHQQPVLTRWGAPSNNKSININQQPQVMYSGSSRPMTMYETPTQGNIWENEGTSYRDRNAAPEVEPRIERRLFSGQQQQHLHQNGGGDVGYQQQHTNGPSGPLYLHQHEGSSQPPFSLHQREEPVPEGKRSGQYDSGTAVHAPVPVPSVDDMEPQSISFIGNQPNAVPGPPRDLHLRISSGTRTYRISSPGHSGSQPERRHIASSLPPVDGAVESVQPNWMHVSKEPSSSLHTEGLRDGVTPEKGFYISLDGDGDTPRRPKPQLRRRQPNVINTPSSAPVSASRPVNSAKYSDEQFDLKSWDNMVGVGSEGESRSEEDEDGMKGPSSGSIDEDIKISGGGGGSAGGRGDNVGLVVDVAPEEMDPGRLDEMERRKERILLLSLQRRERQEEEKRRKEVEALQRREDAKAREEERQRKREEERRRRAEILEKYRLKRAIEEAEREGKQDPYLVKGNQVAPSSLRSNNSSGPRMRGGPGSRPRPKTIHVDSADTPEMRSGTLTPSRGRKGSGSSLAAHKPLQIHQMMDPEGLHVAVTYNLEGVVLAEPLEKLDLRSSGWSNHSECALLHQTDFADAGTTGRPNKGATYQRMTFKGRKSNSLVNLSGSGSDQEGMAFRHADTDSGLGRATPPRRAPSPGMGPHGRHLPSPSGSGSDQEGMAFRHADTDSGLGRATPPRRAPSPGMGPHGRHLPSPSGPGSLPPGCMTRRRPFGDDGASDISSTPSSMLEYTGPRLYKQPTTKSNRGIILNAVEYCVFPGVVNREAKRRVLEEIDRSLSKHFLILFRDSGCQFRALYSYSPEGMGEEVMMGASPQGGQDQVIKLYGTGPRNVTERMFDKFFKYNSGGKCFSQVHTKHLTVTIDAFTIHNSLWQGKKAVNLPNKKDLTLII